MEISDLVNTIEGLTEEQAVEIVSRAETLAEEQAEDLPRRKGGRPSAPAAEPAAEPAAAESADGRRRPPTARRRTSRTSSATASRRTAEVDDRRGRGPADGRGRGRRTTGRTRTSTSAESGEIRDLELAAETSGVDEDGREVTSPPSDADQDETNRIVTEAVESGASPHEIVAHEAGGGPNVPPLPPTEPFSTDEAEGRDSDMQQP